MTINKYQLKKEVEACYRERGRQRPSPADEDRDLRRAWEREMAKRECEQRAAELEAVEAAAEQAEDDEFWREALSPSD